jgi:uncharacterized protein (DUF2164 family)
MSRLAENPHKKNENSYAIELGAKYEKKGLKDADALIAAFTEWVGADVLVTENRHFLNCQADLLFKVLTAEKYLNFI